ncbi:MAG TPA: accessory gene regulator B family protein [Firmicutes bacterium]|nr:accessory gene regulator B family protein [Bacillota bacterium]
MQRWVQPIALWFKDQLGLDEEKTEVVAYALTSLFLIFVDLALLVVVCGLLGVLKEGLIAACTGALLRSVTGGAHLSSPWRCAVLSALLPGFFGYLGKYAGPLLAPEVLLILLLSVLIWGVIIVNKYAPAEVKERPIRPEKRGFYRKAGILLVLFWAIPAFFFLSTNRPALFLAGSCGLWWQTVTLTPPGFAIYRYLSEWRLKRKEAKG